MTFTPLAAVAFITGTNNSRRRAGRGDQFLRRALSRWLIPVLGDEYSVNKPGFNAGMGVALGTKWHGKVFAEARYVHIFLNNGERADYVPVTFGFRW